MEESNATKTSKEGREYDGADGDDDGGGGIDMEKARAVLRAEDKFDREKERARLREARKEKKRKEREAKNKRGKKGETQEEQVGVFHWFQRKKALMEIVFFQDEAESSSNESGGPDLSWLPDPDKVYGKGKGEEESDQSSYASSSGESSEEEEEQR